MQSVSSRIWTRVAVSISDDDNHYTTDTYLYRCVYKAQIPLTLSPSIPINYQSWLVLNGIQSIAVHVLPMYLLTSLLVNEKLQLRYVVGCLGFMAYQPL